MSQAIQLLLVEDNPGDARFLQEVLKESPTEFAITHATRLGTALEMLRANPFEIILLDLTLPDGSGLDTVIRTREAAPQVPIVVLTGLADEGFGVRSVREGAQDYLLKGQIETDVLVRAIRYAIERHRLQLEHARQQKQIERLAAFVQFNPNPVLEFSSSGELLYFNQAAAEIAASLSLPGPKEMLHPETAAIVQESLRSGRPCQNLESPVGPRIISWSFFPIAALEVVHSYAVDVTDRVNLETRLRHSQKMEAVGQLAAGLAHDFNNFLTLIEGHLEVILRRDPPEPFSSSITQALKAVASAEDLTRQLLTFSRGHKAVLTRLNLNQVIQGMVEMVSEPLGQKIRLQINLADGLLPVEADGGMMKQILLNLAVNARDAMPDGGTLTIATEMRELSDTRTADRSGRHPFRTYACVRVADTGTGIDPETVSRIFEPFFSTKAAGAGTGLGLATVYGIVDQHRGWIDVESCLGEGTAFTVYLPVVNHATGSAASG